MTPSEAVASSSGGLTGELWFCDTFDLVLPKFSFIVDLVAGFASRFCSSGRNCVPRSSRCVGRHSLLTCPQASSSTTSLQTTHGIWKGSTLVALFPRVPSAPAVGFVRVDAPPAFSPTAPVAAFFAGKRILVKILLKGWMGLWTEKQRPLFRAHGTPHATWFSERRAALLSTSATALALRLRGEYETHLGASQRRCTDACSIRVQGVANKRSVPSNTEAPPAETGKPLTHSASAGLAKRAASSRLAVG